MESQGARDQMEGWDTKKRRQFASGGLESEEHDDGNVELRRANSSAKRRFEWEKDGALERRSGGIEGVDCEGCSVST
jgi:hypothetical protein